MVPVDVLARTISLHHTRTIMPTTAHGNTTTPVPVTNPLSILPPPDPPPPDDLAIYPMCPPGCLLEGLTQASSPTSITVDLLTTQASTSLLANLPDLPSLTNSVTHIVCSPRVCRVHADRLSFITIYSDLGLATRMVDGGSNVCVTGNVGSLVDVVDIDPITILVVLEGALASYDDCIMKKGLLPLTLSNGTSYYQPCFYCANMVKIIISPAAVLTSSNVFSSWTQEGFKDPTLPGSLRFTNHNGLISMYIPLQCRDSLYYCNTDVYTVNRDPIQLLCNQTLVRRPNPTFHPTTKARQVKSKVWALQFGLPGEHQLDVLPNHVEGTPSKFEYHPFRSINFKEQAYICKQPANKLAERIPGCRSEFFMDFGFLRASSEDYKCPTKAHNWIILSYDGFCAYLLIVNSASMQVWAFLTASKEPLLAILRAFMRKFCLSDSIIKTDQGGELAWSNEFCTAMLDKFGYVNKSTGADSPSQNGGAEIYNNTLAIKVRMLLYGSGLLAKFWSAALIHAIYLHNPLVHLATGITPFKGWYSCKPNVAYLKTVGSWICIKRTGTR
jgi:hypothetical protein